MSAINQCLGPDHPSSQRPEISWAVGLMLAMAMLTGFPSLGQERNHVPGRLLIKPKRALSASEWERRMNGHAVVRHQLLTQTQVHVITAAEEKIASILQQFRNDPEIEFVERDYLAHACLAPNDPYVASGSEWHLNKIHALEAWTVTSGASNVIIAVLDSGINAAHPDLAGKILPGYDFVNGRGDTADDFGHGTAVAGTIVAAGNNAQGVAGVSFGCTLLPVKVMDAYGSASHSAIAQGIEFAVQHGARIINLSLGGDWSSSTLQNAMNYAWNSNVLVVAAAGNNGSTVPQYPAACDHVLAVASSNPDDAKSWFSSYGSYVSLFAPGENIWTTQRDLSNPYGAWSGTSFSSPVVAGVAGLVRSLNPSLSNSEISGLLKQTTDDLGPAGYDSTYAFGRVNALRVVTAISPVPVEAGSDTNQAPPAVEPGPPADTLPPTIEITLGPRDKGRVSVPMVTLAGTATDNIGVERVEIQVNDQPPQKAEGASNWTAQVALVPGPNLVRVRSVDQAGNVSPEATRVLTYVLTVPLTVRINGAGMLVPDLTRRELEVGRTYRVRAVPAPGQVFEGWNGPESSTVLTLTFTMQTNLVLVANFVANPFPAVRGNFSGLLLNSNSVTPENSGYFALAVTRSGSFSGRWLSGAGRLGFSGKFNLAGNATVVPRRGVRPPLNLAFHLDLSNGSEQLTGRASDGRWTSELIADRNIFNASYNPAQQAGLRSFILERAQDSATAAAGQSRIGLGGTTSVRGKLVDGRKFATASALAKNGDCPFYLALNHGQELVIGWLNFPAGQPTASGTVLWVQSGTNAFATTLRATSISSPSH